MDFLDPRSKKRRTIRLLLGYFLVSVMIVTSSVILVFQAYGFDVDRKTGEVIQNGLVFVDSAPDDATIYLNGNRQKSLSNTRLAIPAGSYELKITKDGYRDWTRNFTLSGGSVERFTYPMLIQQTLVPDEIVSLGNAEPAFVTQSPDRRWALVSKADSFTEFFEYDLNNVDKNTDIPRQRSIAFSGDIFTRSDGQRAVELVEWSTDNKHALIKHTYGTGYEFIILNRDNPTESFNINRLLGRTPTAVTLRDKKFDQWYLHTSEGGILETADSSKNIQLIVRNVASYKSHDSETILYVLNSTNSKSQQIFIRQNNNSYLLREVGAGEVKLDIARYDGDWYALVASDTDKVNYIYKDPVSFLEQNVDRKPVPVSILRASTGTFDWVSFSQNTRFMVAQSGQHFEVYDAEYSETYRYNIKAPIDTATEAKWMDGHRILLRSDNNVTIFDFDGSNLQSLIPSLPGQPVYFDRDYTVMYTVNSSGRQATNYGFISTSLRFEQDK